MEHVFYNGWEPLARILVVGVLAYASMVVSLRCSGKRTLSKMNAFDLIVTVSLGSILASVLLNKGIALAEGIFAFTLLISLQFIVTWLSVRFSWIRKLVTGEPQLLFHRGAFLTIAMHRARVTKAEVHAALRAAGIYDLTLVEAVVLETDGSFSVVESGNKSETNTLTNI